MSGRCFKQCVLTGESDKGNPMPTYRIVCRGFAAFLGTLTFVNLCAGVVSPNLDANGWWLDLRPLPAPVEFLVMLIGGAGLLAFATGLRFHAHIRTAAALIILTLGLFA